MDVVQILNMELQQHPKVQEILYIIRDVHDLCASFYLPFRVEQHSLFLASATTDFRILHQQQTGERNITTTLCTPYCMKFWRGF